MAARQRAALPSPLPTALPNPESPTAIGAGREDRGTEIGKLLALSYAMNQAANRTGNLSTRTIHHAASAASQSEKPLTTYYQQVVENPGATTPNGEVKEFKYLLEKSFQRRTPLRTLFRKMHTVFSKRTSTKS